MRSLIPLSLVLFLFGCSWSTSQRPAVLVIALESLNSETFFCSENESEFADGLGLFCANGVRYTHAYTPSTMSQAALASIVTGLYPKDTGVWHNGPQYLSEKFHTVSEVAIEKGYRTAFFSGGPPIWRKSGLGQGFEFFDDNINVKMNEIYRPVQKNFELFLNWLSDSESQKPFFSIIYLADLQFPEKPTMNDLGQERARGFDGQLHEINESLAGLIQKMKKQGVWDNTYVFLTGLNGQTLPSREDETDAINLHSENTQVLLMVKPATKVRDAGLGWTIDANVSLVDIGATLYQIFEGRESQASGDMALEVASLKNSLLKPQVDWSRDRMIMSESAWSNWRGVGGTRISIRKNQMLYIYDNNPLIYNTLTDRFENQQLPTQDASLKTIWLGLKSYFESRGLVPFENIPMTLNEKMRLAHDLNDPQISKESIKIRLGHLVQQRPWDKQIVGWLARLAIKEKDWNTLDKLGQEHLYPLWVYVAKKNRGESAEPPDDVCWRLINKKNHASHNANTCQDTEFLALTEWLYAADSSRKSAAEDKFLRQYNYANLDEDIAWSNFQNGLPWDSAVDIPAEPRFVQLALSLEGYKGLAAKVKNSEPER